jgi:hypothetical protein
MLDFALFDTKEKLFQIAIRVAIIGLCVMALGYPTSLSIFTLTLCGTVESLQENPAFDIATSPTFDYFGLLLLFGMTIFLFSSDVAYLRRHGCRAPIFCNRERWPL